MHLGHPQYVRSQGGGHPDLLRGFLDKLDYLLAALKKNGIYVYPDLLVHRKFREGDGVADFALLGNGPKAWRTFPTGHRVEQEVRQDAVHAQEPLYRKSLAEDPFFVVLNW